MVVVYGTTVVCVETWRKEEQKGVAELIALTFVTRASTSGHQFGVATAFF